MNTGRGRVCVCRMELPEEDEPVANRAPGLLPNGVDVFLGILLLYGYSKRFFPPEEGEKPIFRWS